MSVNANKISLKQQGGQMIPEAPGMIQQPQQPQVDPQVMQITEMIKTSIAEGKDLLEVVKELMTQEVEQELIGHALMMGGMEQEDIITIFETASAPPEPSSPQEVDRDPQLLARNRALKKKETEAAQQAQSQEEEIDISDQVRTMAKSGIEIKPENKGKFTAWAKARGMTPKEAAKKVMANKGKYPPSIVKMANFAKNAAKFKREEGGESGQYINGVFIADESNIDRNTLANNLNRETNLYLPNQNYSVAPLSPPPTTNPLFDFLNTASTVNQELFSNELDPYGNRKGAFKDVFKRGEGISVNNPFKKDEKFQLTPGNPNPDGLSKMEMYKATKPLYYDVDVDMSKMATPENLQAYANWAMQQKKEWDTNTQSQLDEQAQVVSDVSGVAMQEDTTTFSEWAQQAGHDIAKMSESAIQLLQNLWKKTTGKMAKGGGINNAGFKALPPQAQHNIMSNMAMGGESDYLANRDKVIKRAIARQEGKAQPGTEVRYPAEDPMAYEEFPYVMEDYSLEDEADAELIDEENLYDRDGDGIPDVGIDNDGGDGTGEYTLGTSANPSADQLFGEIVTTPEFNVNNKISGTVDRIKDNPLVRAGASGAKAAVDIAGFTNRIYDRKNYARALKGIDERSGADYKYATVTQGPISEGLYDANSGQLQGEAERTPGYYMNFAGSPYTAVGRDGLEIAQYGGNLASVLPAKMLNNSTMKKLLNLNDESAFEIEDIYNEAKNIGSLGEGLSFFNNVSKKDIQRYMNESGINKNEVRSYVEEQDFYNDANWATKQGIKLAMKTKGLKKGGEVVELSQDMIAQLIAAGADIEII